MAQLFPNAPRMSGLRTNRETTLLVTGMLAVTIVAACAFQARETSSSAQADRGWTGNLAVAAPADPLTPAAAKAQPMSSASLVVPKSELALPPLPAKPAMHARASCDSADKYCVVRPAPLAVPPRRQVAAFESGAPILQPEAGSKPEPDSRKPKTQAVEKARPVEKRSLFGSLNPLNHLPDMATIGKPFASAGHTVSGWMKSF